MKRREFIAGSACCGLSSLIAGSLGAQETAGDRQGLTISEALEYLAAGKATNRPPAVRPVILANPRTVFLIETLVEATKNKPGYDGYYIDAVEQLRAEGRRVASELFVKGGELGGATFIKPNFTFVPEHRNHRTNGVYSSPDFIGGIADHLRDLGNLNIVCGEGPTVEENHRHGGVYEAFNDAGLRMIEFGQPLFTDYRDDELNWREVPRSLIWKRIPYCRPVGDTDTFFINVAKLKVHETAITTLTTKNLQGCVPKGYGQFCTPWESLDGGARRDSVNFKRDFYPDYRQRVEESYRRHLEAGYKRLDYLGGYKHYLEKGGWDAYRKVMNDPEACAAFLEGVSPLMMDEMWFQRGLDNASVLVPQMNIIEGIIGLDGTALNNHRIGEDHLCNIVIAGLSVFEVDAVGTWIMGHDPREIWYTRLAHERELGACDVADIDICWIRDSDIVPVRSISDIPRYPLGLNWALAADPSQRLFW